MNDITEQQTVDKLRSLKIVTATVYLFQALTFMLAGLPLLMGVVINFIKRNDVKGTWLESHFDWQIKTTWITLAGFALSGITFELGIGLFIVIATVVWLVFRISVGWFALNDDKPINNKLN